MKREDLIRELEDCAVIGTPGSSAFKKRKVREVTGKLIALVSAEAYSAGASAERDAWQAREPDCVKGCYAAGRMHTLDCEPTEGDKA